MASCYLINNGGNWTDTTKWAASDVSALANINDGATPTAADDVFLTANSGQCTISANSVGKTLTCTGYTNTLTHNGFSLTISGNITFVAGMTYTPLATAILAMPVAGTLTTGGKLIPNFNKSGTGALTLADNLSFMAAKGIVFSLFISGSGLTQSGFTVSGNSTTNRVLINTNTLGSTRTITLGGGTFANADFRDILFNNGGSNLDLSAITGLSGDCGGNGMSGGGSLTFTSPTTQDITMSTNKSWSDATIWTSRVPLPQDSVTATGWTGGILSQDMPRMGKDIDFSGASGTTTLSANSIAQTVYGSLNLTGLTTFTTASSGQFIFETRSASTLTSNGKLFAGINPVCLFAMFGGSIAIQDALGSTAGNMNHSHGTITNPNNSSVNVSTWGGNFTTTRRMDMTDLSGGTATWTISGVGTSWNINGTGITVNAAGSTISMTDVSGTAKTFAGGGQTYNNLSISSDGSAGTTTISGSNTFTGSWTIGAGGAKTIALTDATTQTFSNAQTGLGNGANIITFQKTGASTDPIISCASGIFSWSSVSLTNIDASTGATFYAGAAPPSVDGTGNANWIFTDPPAGGAATGSMSTNTGYWGAI
jgi:fibronectin-binding autotransporter adhesin